jgi:hypothetical protein
VAERLGRGEAEGRFVERVAGSYVFAPAAAGLPQLPVLNPEAVSELAVGPLLVVKGQVDPQGRLRVEHYALKPITPAAGPAAGLPQRAQTATSAIVSTLGAAIRPGAVSFSDRNSMATSLRGGIREIVLAYRDALAAGDAAGATAIVEQWAELRPGILEVFSDATELKAIYDQPDNYAPWRYDRVYQQSRAVVAIGEPGQPTARCSGVLIASDLVLTAAHCFSGPPPREPGELEVWFDYAELPGGTLPVQRRRILAPVAPAPARWPALMGGAFDASLLDYAIVRFDASAAAGPLPNRPEPQCLRGVPLARGDAIYVVGYPRGERATVHDNARVYLPFRLLDGEPFYQLRLDVEADFLDRPDRVEVMRQFDASYELQQSPTGIQWRYFYNVTDGGQPRMGIVADTFRGNSGGPVYDHEREQCVVGILNRGAADTGVRRTANWKEHEHVLPVRAILDDLQKDPATAAIVAGLSVRE